MTSNNATENKNEDSAFREKALELVNWLMEKSINGIPPLSSAYDLAQEYLLDKSYKNNEERVESLIRFEMSKNFTSGFLTGFGGILTLPINITGAIAASYIIQARMAAAIAAIYGHDIREDRVKTVILLSVIMDITAKEPTKDALVRLSTTLLKKSIQIIPGTVLRRINGYIGTRLITKAGTKGVINLGRVVPVAGGFLAGSIDAWYCNAVGNAANAIFNPGRQEEVVIIDIDNLDDDLGFEIN